MLAYFWLIFYVVHAFLPERWLIEWYGFPALMTMVAGGAACFGAWAYFDMSRSQCDIQRGQQ